MSMVLLESYNAVAESLQLGTRSIELALERGDESGLRAVAASITVTQSIELTQHTVEFGILFKIDLHCGGSLTRAELRHGGIDLAAGHGELKLLAGSTRGAPGIYCYVATKLRIVGIGLLRHADT